MSDKKYYVNCADGSTRKPLLDHFHCRFRSPSADSLVQGCELSTMMNRKAYEVDVGDLTVSGKPLFDLFQRVNNRKRIGPEVMAWKVQIRLQYTQCVRGSQCVG